VTNRVVGLVRVRTTRVRRIAHVVRALVSVITVHVATELCIDTGAVFATTGETAEVTSRTVGPVTVFAGTVAAFADVVRALVLVIAVDGDAQANAPSRVALARVSLGIAGCAMLGIGV
jgi:hypothetical protein